MDCVRPTRLVCQQNTEYPAEEEAIYSWSRTRFFHQWPKQQVSRDACICDTRVERVLSNIRAAPPLKCGGLRINETEE